jgi:CBS domain containing-hemolysin-like protein
MLVALLAVALATIALLSGAETAFATANRLRTELRSQRSGRAGRVARAYMNAPEPLLAAAVAGTILAALVAAGSFAVLLEAPLEAAWGRLLAGPWRTAAVVTTQFLAAAAAILAAQILPKALLREPPERVVVAVALPLKAAEWLLTPVTWAARRLAGALLPRGLAARPPGREFDTAMRDVAGETDLDVEEKEMLENVMELRTLRVHDTMIPRTEIRAVEQGADIETVRSVFVESGYSRLPVYRESLDRVVGVVLAHDLFHDPESLAAITRSVPFVPESRPARDLLFELLRDGVTMAVVLDEFGGTAGVVTVEDLLEEVFGDIRDEHDLAEPMLRRLDERTVLAAGRASLDDLEERLGLIIPQGEYDTVGGYLLDRVGTIPEARQTFEFDGLRLTVMDATASRIGTVRIEETGGDS